jgi:hypothetical protein
MRHVPQDCTLDSLCSKSITTGAQLGGTQLLAHADKIILLRENIFNAENQELS